MHESLLIAGTALTLVLLYRLFRTPKIRRNGSPLRKAPDTLPLVGNGIKFLQARHKLFSWFVKCERHFGYETLQISVPSLPPGVLINDPRNLEFVFKNEAVFNKGQFVRGTLWDLFGYGIIIADGDLWRLQRKAGLNFFNTSNLQVLTDIALPKYLSKAVDYLKTKCDGTPFDLQVVLLELTSQLMGKMAYNMEMHSDDDFTRAFDYASGATMERFQNPLWPVTDWFLGGKLRSALVTVKSLGKTLVAKAIADRQLETPASKTASAAEGKLNEISGSLIQSFLDSIGDEQIVADAALNYLSAGRDTTAQALTWTFYTLMKQRYVMGKVRQEVHQVLEDHDASFDPQDFDSTLFTPVSMPYTMAVFYEVLRLYPSIPIQIKQCAEAATLPDGTFLPKSSLLIWSIWSMNRSKHTWGDDADSFKPERWLADGKLISKSASEFPVFNGGPRTCLGKKMAEAVAVQVVATMACMFDFIPVDDKQRVSKPSLTLPMEGGLPCFVRARSHVVV